MIKEIFGTLLLGLAAQGCMVSEVLYVDGRFSPAEQADIQAASDEWVRATGMHVDMVFGTDVNDSSHKRLLVRDASEADVNDDHQRAFFASHLQASGNTNITHGPSGVTGERIDIVVSRVPAGSFRALVTHEFGHHLGMEGKHVDDPKALMNANVGASCITHSDAVGYCASVGCDPETINFCK